MPKRCVISLLALACCSTEFAHAQGAANNPHLRLTQQYDWTFSEIGDVGNAPAIVHNWNQGVEFPGFTRPVGQVNHRYRVATTEVTWGQYFEFIEAHSRTLPVNIRDGIVSSDYITPGPSPIPSPITYIGFSNGQAHYSIDAARANQPATSTWRYFARMVNWLHNGKPDVDHAVASDFETGVYDTSTFGRVSNGPTGPYYTDQDTRSEGARFWIPSMDELTKAAFYDPNKGGDGEGGWWQWGNSSDEQPIPGEPALGGQANAGAQVPGNNQWPEGHARPLDVGSYPGEQSPWGLLDSAGGGREWTESWREDSEEFEQNNRLVLPSGAFRLIERGYLGDFEATSSPDRYPTLRLAMAVPAPGATIMIFLPGLLAARRRW